MTIDDIFNNCAENLRIFDSMVITKNKLKNYDFIMCSISGGSNSDILLDLIFKLDKDKKVIYVFFDTGLEYEATKEHLRFLEEKYGIKIHVVKAVKPIPISCREYGQPFLSKQVSEWISRLQRHNFKWEDKSYEELLKEYPNCKASLKWWCNKWDKGKNGRESKFNIAYNKWLKEFMIVNPPAHFISNKCCTGAKKDPAKKFKRENDIELSITGVRKAEGGARATAYKNCFTSYDDKADEYRAIFWYTNGDKSDYEKAFNVQHNRCYTEYGLTRTGCSGCPFGNDFEKELEIIEKYEPKLYKAVNKIFGDSYEYTRKYREFVEEKEREVKNERNENTD